MFRNRKVESQNPEETYEVLEKYAKNLVELAREGKNRSHHRKRQRNSSSHSNYFRRDQEQSDFGGEPGVGKTAIAEGLAQRIF